MYFWGLFNHCYDIQCAMSVSAPHPDSTAAAAQTIASELSALTTRSNDSSHKLCQYVLENVLLHQAAAQQLQVGVLAGVLAAAKPRPPHQFMRSRLGHDLERNTESSLCCQRHHRALERLW